MAGKRYRYFSLAVLLSMWIGVMPVLGGAPRPGASPLDPQNRMRISPSDRCPVCAMLPVRYPKFAAAIQLKNGRTYYFCCAGCMITAWLHPEVYLNTSRSRIERAVAHGYFSGEPADASDFLWVGGSDVSGPMGPAVVPLSNPSEVRMFRKRHGGSEAFTLDELTDEKWKAIRSPGRPTP